MGSRASSRKPDLVRVLEAAYAVDDSEPAWLKGLVDAIRPAVEDGLGMAAYVYDTADRPFRIRHLLVEDCPVDASGIAMLQDQSHDDFVRSSWINRAAMTASETPGYDTHPGVLEVFHPAGIRDVMVVNALDPLGVGCWVGAPLRRVRRLEGEERERWNRVATHVRASLRLRLRLAARGNGNGRGARNGAGTNEGSAAAGEPERGGDAAAEAVLRADGEAVHLEPAAEASRGALRDAVLGIHRARTVLRDDPDRALPSWKALVRARWTLVDDVEADGTHYIVARANALDDAKLISRLSFRERQVVACLAMGHTNKEAAYELGLSHSTVRVLVARACAKLGAPTREQLGGTSRRESVG